ncbi:MAG TPA: hypothetical protein VGN98_02775 [Tianweitania sediminis]|jgi:hypothetical protein|nr:hypothetical protein [Tianweitania sediminis]
MTTPAHDDLHRKAHLLANLFHAKLLHEDLAATIAKALIEEREQSAGIALKMPEQMPKGPGLMRVTKPIDVYHAIMEPRP